MEAALEVVDSFFGEPEPPEPVQFRTGLYGFDPNPPRGEVGDGTEVDLFNDGAPVTWEKPALVSATYKDDRWRKYLVNLWMQENSKRR